MNYFGGHLRWAGKLAVPEKAHPLVRRLFELMNEERVCMHDVAARAGVRRGTISDWRYNRNPQLPVFEAACNALGYELVIRPRRGE